MGISSYIKNLRGKIGTGLLQVPSVAAIIRDESGRVLLQLRTSDGRWSLPAGAIDPGESPAEAIVREAREETGLHVTPRKIVGVFGGEGFAHTYGNGDSVEYLAVLFACDVIGGELRGEDDETAELRYFDPREMPDLAQPYPRHLFARDADGETYFRRPAES
jgi:8-oxo-dGTP pyrophosphatase MutT (NUDIX family)